MKPRLIILSDLWGAEKQDWIQYYLTVLESEFDIIYYDCCDLGELDKTILKEEALHSQFMNGGIETAVNNLLDLETKKVNILAFSIGGTIAWKAGLKGLDINKLYAVSSTRLRYETETPDCSIKLLYSAYDNYKPNSDWFENVGVKYAIINEGDHQIYKNKAFAIQVCKEIIDSYKY